MSELFTLNDEQRDAAQHPGGHVLVLAGAGTGKTRTIVARAAYLIEQGVVPERIAVLTFTRRAAGELRARLGGLVGEDQARLLSAGTFHHFCLTHMRRRPRLFGLEDTTVIDRDDSEQLFKLARGEIDAEDRALPKARQLADLYSYSRNTNRTLREYLHKYSDQDPAVFDDIIAACRGYEERKKAHRYLDFDDILHSFARILSSSPEAANKLRASYDHILVDEMQDTNPLQWAILDALRDPAQLFCVGDDAQSIYAFRGADFRNVHSFTSRLPDSSLRKLEGNYRSTQEILDLANWLLEQSPLEYNKRLVSLRGSGMRPVLIEFGDPFEEAGWIARDLVRRRGEGADWKEQMVLMRTAFAGRAIEAACLQHNIPYRFIGGTSLLESAHIRDLLSVVRCVINPRDELAWIRYLTLWPKLGEKTATRYINAIVQSPDTATALSQLEEAFGPQPAFEPLHRVQENLDSPSAAFAAAGRGITDLMERKYANWSARQRDFAFIERLAERTSTMREFLDTYALDPIESTAAREQEDLDAVMVITIHRAKGTEAPVCYVIRAEPGMYPHSRSVGQPDEEEEERRILYVALTRAQDELILTRTQEMRGARVAWGGHTAATSETPYLLQDMPDHLVDLHTFPSASFAPSRPQSNSPAIVDPFA